MHYLCEIIIYANMRKTILLFLSVVLALNALAGTRDDFKANCKQSANNYFAYPDDHLPALTPAPAGYEPFYIDHYGRHGSRWLISENQYHDPVAALEKADSAGLLTQRGKEALAIFKDAEKASYKRLGELSDIGAEQHQRIAKRMFENYPQVFAGDAPIDAKSTIVIRCILSMQNEVSMLKSLNPQLRITTDASNHDMYFMNYDDPVAKSLRKDAFADDSKALKDKYLKVDHMLKVLFKDVKWAKKNFDVQDLALKMLDLVGNMQSHHQFENVDLYDLFSLDEMVNIWNYNNARWYLWAGNTPLTKGRVPYMEANLLRDFISAADQALSTGRNCATLRFGHESVVLPFVCLMGLNGMDLSTTDIYSLTDRWQSYKVFPMAANVQWVFFRKPGSSDYLVKVLLNEREATLPATVKTDCAPYYHWADMKAYYEKVLTAEPQISLPETANDEKSANR